MEGKCPIAQKLDCMQECCYKHILICPTCHGLGRIDLAERTRFFLPRSFPPTFSYTRPIPIFSPLFFPMKVPAEKCSTHHCLKNKPESLTCKKENKVVAVDAAPSSKLETCTKSGDCAGIIEGKRQNMNTIANENNKLKEKPEKIDMQLANFDVNIEKSQVKNCEHVVSAGGDFHVISQQNNVRVEKENDAITYSDGSSICSQDSKALSEENAEEHLHENGTILHTQELEDENFEKDNDLKVETGGNSEEDLLNILEPLDILESESEAEDHSKIYDNTATSEDCGECLAVHQVENTELKIESNRKEWIELFPNNDEIESELNECECFSNPSFELNDLETEFYGMECELPEEILEEGVYEMKKTVQVQEAATQTPDGRVLSNDTLMANTGHKCDIPLDNEREGEEMQSKLNGHCITMRYLRPKKNITKNMENTEYSRLLETEKTIKVEKKVHTSPTEFSKNEEPPLHKTPLFSKRELQVSKSVPKISLTKEEGPKMTLEKGIGGKSQGEKEEVRMKKVGLERERTPVLTRSRERRSISNSKRWNY